MSNVAASPAALALDEADAHFDAGRYSEAAAAYDSAVRNYPSMESPQVLFRQALALLLENGRGQSQAMALLRKLVEVDAASSLGAASKVILELLENVQRLGRTNDANEAKIKQLSEELEKLKKLDMRRRPAKP